MDSSGPNGAGTASSRSFEEQLAELERVVEQLERGDLPLEDSVALFERGMTLNEACRTQLASAESRIQVLLNPREKGPVRTEVLEVEADEEDERADSNTRSFTEG